MNMEGIVRLGLLITLYQSDRKKGLILNSRWEFITSFLVMKWNAKHQRDKVEGNLAYSKLWKSNFYLITLYTNTGRKRFD